MRLYRKKACELHPDKGGSHKKFSEPDRAGNEFPRTRS